MLSREKQGQRCKRLHWHSLGQPLQHQYHTDYLADIYCTQLIHTARAIISFSTCDSGWPGISYISQTFHSHFSCRSRAKPPHPAHPNTTCSNLFAIEASIQSGKILALIFTHSLYSDTSRKTGFPSFSRIICYW